MSERQKVFCEPVRPVTRGGYAGSRHRTVKRLVALSCLLATTLVFGVCASGAAASGEDPWVSCWVAPNDACWGFTHHLATVYGTYQGANPLWIEVAAWCNDPAGCARDIEFRGYAHANTTAVGGCLKNGCGDATRLYREVVFNEGPDAHTLWITGGW